MPGKGKNKEGGGVPQGWSKGKKTGWQGAEMPPGRSRKAVADIESEPPGENTPTQSAEQDALSGAQSQADTNRTF